MKKKLLVFASGTREWGGSGFENLVHSLQGVQIVGVVSNHADGCVRARAERLEVPFFHFPAPWDEAGYRRIALKSGADFFALSGWLKLVRGLDPRFTFNIHPGPLPEFGGSGMYGHHVHKRVLEAFRRGEITHSAVCMHFLSPESEYDRGPIFFRYKIKIEKEDTPESLASRVNEAEKKYQPALTSMVCKKSIAWDGISAESLVFPTGYSIERGG